MAETHDNPMSIPEGAGAHLQGSPSDWPMVTFIILSYNRCDQVLRAVQSVIRQDYPNKEIFVVDNASTDNTVPTLRKAFPSVNIISNTTNPGVGAGRNQAIRASIGECLVFIDDDCVIESTNLAHSVVCQFQLDHTCGAVSFRLTDPKTGSPWPYIPRLGGDLPYAYACGTFFGGGVALRRETLFHVGLFWEPYFFGDEDRDLALRMIRAGWNILRRSDLIIWHVPPSKGGPINLNRVYYMQVRNLIWFALRNLPLVLIPGIMTPLIARLFVQAVRHGAMPCFIRGITAGLRRIPSILSEREPVTRAHMKRIRQLNTKLL